MRRLLPTVADEDLDRLYTEMSFPESPADRPLVFLDMVMSVDGAATVAGRTRALGGEADQLAFARLREWCDVILVGASTVRIEGYGPPRADDERRQRRVERGLDALPRIAVVTASAALDPGARLFTDQERRAIVLAPANADHARIAALDEVADVMQHGTDRVDLRAALGALRQDGVSRILCEGGPTLNAELFHAGLVDEIFLTMTPVVVGDSAHRIVDGALPAPVEVELVELRTHASELLLRYRVQTGA